MVPLAIKLDPLSNFLKLKIFLYMLMKNNLNTGVLGPINFIQMPFCSTCASDSDCIHVQENEMFPVHYVSGFPK